MRDIDTRPTDVSGRLELVVSESERAVDAKNSSPATSEKERVLHVTDSLLSGVGAVVASIASEMKAPTRVLAYRRKGIAGVQMPGAELVWVDRRRDYIAALVKEFREFRPTVVHFHSARAGVLRVLPIPATVVYSPHCYGFEQLNLNRLVARLIRLFETGLSYRTDLVVAVGAHEATLARSMRQAIRTKVLPHELFIAEPDTMDSPAAHPGALEIHLDEKPTIVMSGRLSPQKDPLWFAELAKALGTEVRAIWIGGGDPNVSQEEPGYEATMESAGVHITGWLERSVGLGVVANSTLYVHSGHWEGFPVSVAEAADLGVGVMARAIPSMEAELPSSLILPESPKAAADVLKSVLAQQTEVDRIIAETLRWRDKSILQRQATMSGLYKFDE